MSKTTSKTHPITVRHREEHNTNLLDYANKKRLNGEFNNVTIHVGGKSISANRMILSCFSKYFESKFTSLKESCQDTVVIEEVDGEAVSSLIEYIYIGSISINPENVMALLSAADFLQMDDVKRFCSDFFETTLSVEDCLQMFISSLTYNKPSPLKKILQLISSNFDAISKTDTFKNLPEIELNLLLSKIRQFNVQEEYLYSGILNWVKHDEDRKQHFASFFLTFDLDKLSNEFIEDEMADEPLVNDNKDCLKAVLTRLISDSKKIRRKAKAPKILCAGGVNSKSTVEIYNSLGESSSVSYPDFPHRMSHHCLLAFNDIIYSVGGDISRGFSVKISKKVYKMDLKDQNLQWNEAKSMILERYKFGAVTFDEYIVVAGGWCGGSTRLNCAELFEVRFNTWKKIARLNSCRTGLAMAVANGDIFAIGGENENGVLSSVEQLHELYGNWINVQAMNTPRSSLAAVSCNDLLYAIGGENNELKAEKTVEVYDPKKNEWSFVASMIKERRYHAACVLQGKIFVVGGTDSNHAAVTSMECYDPSLDKWSTVGEVDCQNVGHAIVSVYDSS